MKKHSMKIIALCLCAALAAGGVTTTAFALNTGEEKNKAKADLKASSGAGDATDAAGAAKDETVYVLAGADGSVRKIIVSDWIKNTVGSAKLEDESELTNIENVKGDETYTINGDNMRVWDAKGNDIYYQGNIEKELPVGLSVSYKLDGKPVTAEDLAGKSGRVTIRFDYQNKQYEMVDIDGRQEKIYVPFVMLTGVLMDNEVFKNVTVANGKIINDGSRNVVAGIAFPGLQDNLAVSRDKLEIPDYVEISADAKDFSLDMTVTLATNEPFSKPDMGGLDSIRELGASMDDLAGAMERLLDGSSRLYDGIATLLEKSNELAEGIDKLATGAESLKSGSRSLNEGAAKLQTGAAQLSGGLDTLASNNDTLNAGAKQVFDTLLSEANTRLAAAGLQVPALTADNYAEVLNGVIASLEKNAARGQEQSAAAAKSVIALKASLDNYNTFYLGLKNYTAGVSDAAAGAKTLKAGSDNLKAGTGDLAAGAAQLCDGIITLKNGTPALVEGVTQLRDGSMQLSGGLMEFNEKGIQKLVDAVDGDLNGLMTRLRATRDVSLNYKNFAGAGEDMDGQVKFIYRTDSIE